MKPHRILKTFPGSQTGNDYNIFNEGDTVPLSDDLAKIAIGQGWAEPVNGKAEDREMKVEAPEETKPMTAKEKKAAKKAAEDAEA